MKGERICGVLVICYTVAYVLESALGEGEGTARPYCAIIREAGQSHQVASLVAMEKDGIGKRLPLEVKVVRMEMPWPPASASYRKRVSQRCNDPATSPVGLLSLYKMGNLKGSCNEFATTALFCTKLSTFCIVLPLHPVVVVIAFSVICFVLFHYSLPFFHYPPTWYVHLRDATSCETEHPKIRQVWCPFQPIP